VPHEIRKTSLQLAGLIGLLIGVGLGAKLTPVSPAYAATATIIVALAYKRHRISSLLVIFLAAVTIGLWRGGVYVQKAQAYDPYYDRKIMLTARVLNDGVYGSHSQLSFDADSIQINNNLLAGNIKISGFGTTMVYAGNRVEIEGKLRHGLGQYRGFVSYAKISIVDQRTSVIASLRRKFVAGLQTALPEPLASFAAGLLIGQRSTLPDSIKQDLLMVGLTHIIAVSGYNVTIMLRSSQRLLGKRSKRLSTFIALGLIAVFLLFTGSSASIVRAAIVSGLSIWAGYYGRRFKPLNLILVAAAITATANPFYIWSDAGWYLSFLAFYGVLVLAPAISRHWTRRWQGSVLAMIALESLSAELMTMPYVLHMFGQMSLIGLPANVLVVTLVPLAMLLSLLAGLVGMSGLASGWLALPAQIVLTYMLDVAHLFASLPHIFLHELELSTAQMMFLYACMLAICAAFLYKSRPKNSIITDRK
jgi:competence protein ComEC